jgi:hypothetical protein
MGRNELLTPEHIFMGQAVHIVCFINSGQPSQVYGLVSGHSNSSLTGEDADVHNV